MIDLNKIADLEATEIIKLIAIIVGFTILLTSAIWCAHYRYVDCLKVGHTKLYCMMTIGK